MKSLNYLYLEDTSIVGTIPSSLGQLTNLKELNIAGCTRLTGTVPTEFGQLSDVSLFWLFGNDVRFRF